MLRRIVRTIVCLLLVNLFCAIPTSWAQAGNKAGNAAWSNLLVIVSDLHLGVGRVRESGTQGEWHAMEDFRWHAEFKEFVDAQQKMASDAGVGLRLIIAGDFIELWQSTEDDCFKGRTKDASCTEEEALLRFMRVARGHSDTLALIGSITNRVGNEVIIIPGNHDAALMFPKVADALLASLKGNRNQISLRTQGFWQSDDGEFFVEHGHFIEGDVNKYSLLPASCLDENSADVACGERKAKYLSRPWGEQFVQKYYNQFEVKFPIIDNFTSEAYAVKLALTTLPAAEIAEALFGGLKFLIFDQSLAQFGNALGEGEGAAHKPDWDVKSEKEKGGAFLIASFPKGDPLGSLVTANKHQLDLDGIVAMLSLDEIRQICDMRSDIVEAAKSKGELTKISKCVDKKATAGAAITRALNSEADLISKRIKEVSRGVAKDSAKSGLFSSYIFGHTHAAKGKIRAFAAEKGWNPYVLNTGAWQRVVSPAVFERILLEKKIDKTAALRIVRLEDLPACYSFVRVSSYVKGTSAPPAPELLYWAKPSDTNSWRTFTGCP